MRRRIIVLIAVCLLLQCTCITDAFAWWSFDISPGSSTHSKLGGKTVDLVGESAYPDIDTFKYTDILHTNGIVPWMSGGTNDNNAHGRVLHGINGNEGRDDAGSFNGGPIRAWWGNDPRFPTDGVLPQYKLFNFSGGEFSAYYYLAMMAHLISDQAAPAHAANIPHLSPKSDLIDLEGYGDNLENNAFFMESPQPCESCHGSSPPAKVIDSQEVIDYYLGPTEGMIAKTKNNLPSWKLNSTSVPYWKAAPSYVGGIFDDVWGHYGVDAFAPDTFSNSADTQDIIQNQYNQSIYYMLGFLQAASKKLPPLVRDLEIQPANDWVPYIDMANGTDITFSILENRTPNVKITIRALVGLSGYTVRANGKDWYEVEETLGPGADLPYYGDITLNDWKGEIAGGGILQNGAYTLAIEVKDEDGNEVNAVYPDINSDSISENNTVHEFQIAVPPPGPVANLRTTTGNREVLVAWDPPDTLGGLGLKGYVVRYSTLSFQDPAAVELPYDALHFQSDLTSLTNGKLYFITVTAVDTAGNESEPARITAKPRGDVIWVNAPDSALPGQYTSIQAALSAASSGSTILVGPGTYPEKGIFMTPDQENITLISERGPAKTIINGTGATTYTVSVHHNCKVIGFTIKNNPNLSEAAIQFITQENVLIANNIVLANNTGLQTSGRGVYIYNNTFVGNVKATVFQLGGNYFLDIQNNIIAGNGKGIDFHRMYNYSMGSNTFYDNDISLMIDDVPSNLPLSNDECNPQFQGTDELIPATFYHPAPGSSCTEDMGNRSLYYENEPWRDCISWEGNKYRADRGAFGGPYAYIDKDGNDIPDCEQGHGIGMAAFIYKNSEPVPITLAGHNPQGGMLTYRVETPPGHGELSGAAPILSYRVEHDFVGTDSFDFKVASGAMESGAEPVSITVKEANTNRPPEAQDITVKVFPVPEMNRGAVFTLSGSDADGDQIWFTIESLPLSGQLITTHNPECFHIPVDGFIGEVSFAYHASDGFADSNPATVRIIYNNDPVIDSYFPEKPDVVIGEDGSQLFGVTASDADQQTLTYSWKLEKILNGELIDSGTGNSYVFNPTFGSAIDSPYNLTVTVSDGVVYDGMVPVTHSWTIVVEDAAILDDAACTSSANWVDVFIGTGYFGRGFKLHQAGSGVAYATWSYTIPVTGNYKVYARWPAAANYTTSALYRVSYAGDRYDDLVVDQTRNGGQWNLLGTYTFAEGYGAWVKLKVGSAEVAVADAVKFVATDAQADVILDDIDGVPNHANPSPWGSAAEGVNELCLTIAAGTGNETFTWAFPPVDSGTGMEPGAFMVPGTYEVYAWWKSVAGGASNAKYVVNFGDGRTSQVTVDQTVNGKRWVQLGTYYFGQGDAPSVELSDNANGTVVADGVKLVYLSDKMSNIIETDADPDFLPANEDYCGWSGTWQGKTYGSGYIGSNFRQMDAGNAGSWLKWTLPIAAAGNYEVYARWTSNTGRSAGAKYEVKRSATAIPTTVIVDQRANGGKWYHLGRIRFDDLAENEKSVTLYQSADGTVAADAIMYLKTDEELPITVDNNSPKFTTQTGNWAPPTSLTTGYWGPNYFQVTGAGNYATWTPEIVTAGNYDVFAWWPAAADRSTAVKYTISHDTGRTTEILQNQRINGSMWNNLGRYYLPAGILSSVRIDSQDTSVTVADAVRFEYTTLPLPIVIDNLTIDGLDRFGVINGTWSEGSVLSDYYPLPDPSNPGLARNYRWHAVRQGSDLSTVRWTPSITERGYYAVYAWWPVGNSNHATDSPFRIVHAMAPGGEVRAMNQQINGGQWNYLGTFLFNGGENAGEGGFVELSDSTTGKVLADAVKFVREGD